MDFSILEIIFGILSTIAIALIFDLIGRKRYPGKLTLVKQSSIGLFNNIAKNFEEISIKYKGEPIKENIIYIEASFLNDGDIDIDGSRDEKSVTLNLKEGLKWIKAEITNRSPGFRAPTLRT